MKKNILNVFIKPLYVQYCSQTIYQVLIGCIRLYEATEEIIWFERAKKLCNILISIQQPDGGFDIGYEFNFGRLHKKGESTSPELVGLSALVKFYKISKCASTLEAAYKAANWIKNNSIKLDDGMWMIPYAPYSIKDVMVYNGTSFAAGALGEFLSIVQDKELDKIYRGMIKYLKSVMSSDSISEGKFWFYSDQNRKDLSIEGRYKIDYYHQMQQVEVHSEAQILNPNVDQKFIISLAAKYISSKQNRNGIIPYLNLKSNIHLWGFCSCASGFLLGGRIDDIMYHEYRYRAELIYKWIVKYSWTGEYFLPILSHENEIIDDRFYVRSDAWVFNSFALAVKEGLEFEKYLEICEKSYNTMDKVDFSGLENHASNRKKRFFTSILISAGKIKNSLWQK